MSGVRVALRIARRDALRAKGRSALVVAMIGVPMLALGFADVALRTSELPPAERVRREIGTADLVAEQVSTAPIEQRGPYGYGSLDGDGVSLTHQRERRPLDLAPHLPAGSRVVERQSFHGVNIGANDRLVAGSLESVDLRSPVMDGIVRLESGALPARPGEAAVTVETAGTLGIAPGDTVSVPGAGDYRVTGVVVEPGDVRANDVYVPPGTPLPERIGVTDIALRRYAVDLPAGVRETDLVAPLNRLGLYVQPRAWLLDPPEEYDGASRADLEDAGVTVVVVGLAVLEVALLAGTAFAVGARRRRRELALLAATGGDRRDVRRVVLAGAVVLGAVSGVVGVAGGILAVVLLRSRLERASGAMFGPLDVRPLELGAIVALGAGTALLAALLPARAAARQHVVGALTGRRGDAPLRKRVPVVALVAIVAGAALAFWAAGEVGTVPEGPDGSDVPGRPDGARSANYPLLLLGAVVAELGFIACAPALVALVGATAGRLPLALRLAARDAARHRTRSGPAVAAVVAAVAGSVALSVYLASDTEQQRREYTPFLASDGVRIGRTGSNGPVPQRDIDAAVAVLPVRERIDAYDVADACPGTDPCDLWTVELSEERQCVKEQPCAHPPRFGTLTAGPPTLVEWTTGHRDAAAEAAMRDGKVVVFDDRFVRDGKVVVLRERYSGDTPRTLARVAIPAYVHARPTVGEAPVAVVTAETARAHRLPLQPGGTFLLTSRPPTQREEAAAYAALARATPFAEIYVERGFRSNVAVELLVLALAAGAVTLAATGIATGLAAADSRPDLATLAAVGAAPRIRRRLVMAQAATVALLGSALGLLAGLVPAGAVVAARADFPLALPWTALGISVLGVPLFAALLTGAFIRSRLPLDRRVA